MARGRYRFGDFEFDADTGDLWRRGSAGGADAQRLPPQPAELLALLVEKRGDLVGREEIRARIWPGVSVEFDPSLHFCIRQIRAALEDSAKEPRYIENLPKRGYRLIPTVESSGSVAAEPRSPRHAWTRRGLGAAVAVAALVATTLIVVGLGSHRPEDPKLRIAIMPFVPPAGDAGFGDTRPIAEAILEDLVLAAGDRADVVGPTSTSGYDASSSSLRELAAAHDLHYIVNGRFLVDEGGPGMLAELIRVSDGRHVWVRRYDDLREGRRIGREISQSVSRELKLAGP